MRTDVGTQQLETRRLILRKLTVDDCKDMYENWANDPDVTQYLRWEPHKDWTFTAELLSVWEKEYSKPQYYQWGVVRKRDGVLIGAISAFEAEQSSEDLEIGYCYGKAYWNHGYATEALRAVCAFLFDEVHMPRLTCCHAKENPPSGAVMRKVGFSCIGEDIYHKFNGTEVACYCYILTQEKFIRHALL